MVQYLYLWIILESERIGNLTQDKLEGIKKTTEF